MLKQGRRLARIECAINAQRRGEWEWGLTVGVSSLLQALSISSGRSRTRLEVESKDDSTRQRRALNEVELRLNVVTCTSPATSEEIPVVHARCGVTNASSLFASDRHCSLLRQHPPT